MGEYIIKLPDVGEGVAEAELVEWHAAPGDVVKEDDLLAAVMTDKATIEIPSPVDGKIVWLGGEIGEVLAVGSPLLRLEVEGEGNAGEAPSESAGPKSEPSDSEPQLVSPPEKEASTDVPTESAKPPSPTTTTTKTSSPSQPVHRRAEGEAVLASPSVRKRARDNGVDLKYVSGSGPAGRLTHEDLDAYFQTDGMPTNPGRVANTSVEEIKVIGLRRRIAEKMSISKTRIPHITYVDEIDMEDVEKLRAELNKSRADGQPKLTILPFLMLAMAKAIQEQPQLNSLYDDDAGIVRQYGGLHMGIAAQTDNGLVVPVVKHVEALSIWECASEVSRLAEAAKNGTATREELSGSTITITSLGALGGLVTTPVINHPEVAIIGVNKMQIKPVWDGSSFVPRKTMNVSSSFDHRIIDGWDAAVFVQTIKRLLEAPATLFIDG